MLVLTPGLLAEFEDRPEGSLKSGFDMAINNRGNLMVVSKDRTVIVSRLSSDSGQVAVQPVRTFMFDETRYGADVRRAQVLWSHTDAYAAVGHVVHKRPSGQNLHGADMVDDPFLRVTYLYSTATGTLQEVPFKPPPESACPFPMFSGRGQYLIMPFSVDGHQGRLFDIFLTATNAFHARISTAVDLHSMLNTDVQPTGPIFAGDVFESERVAFFDCKICSVKGFVFPGVGGDKDYKDIAFSSNGGELVVYQKNREGQPSPSIHLLDITTSTCTQTHLQMQPEAYAKFGSLRCTFVALVLKHCKHMQKSAGQAVRGSRGRMANCEPNAEWTNHGIWTEQPERANLDTRSCMEKI